MCFSACCCIAFTRAGSMITTQINFVPLGEEFQHIANLASSCPNLVYQSIWLSSDSTAPHAHTRSPYIIVNSFFLYMMMGEPEGETFRKSFSYYTKFPPQYPKIQRDARLSFTYYTHFLKPRFKTSGGPLHRGENTH